MSGAFERNDCAKGCERFSIPNDYEAKNVGEVLNGFVGDFFTQNLFRSIATADQQNKERLRIVYPHHVACYEAWRRGDIWSELQMMDSFGPQGPPIISYSVKNKNKKRT